MNAATNDSSPFVFYKSMVAEAAGLSVETLDRFRVRLHAAYDMGEPVWMIAGEVKLRAAAPRIAKTPKHLAARFVTIGS